MKLAKLWRRFVNRLKQSVDREAEQSIVRLMIALLLNLYTFYLYSNRVADEPTWTLLFFSLVYTISSLVVIAAIALQPLRFHVRRTITMLFDVGMVTIAMWVGGESTSMLYVFYLWISLGNGFRFGIPSLYLTCALSCLGFAFVIMVSDFWIVQPILSVGLLIGLLVTTLYVSLLLKRIENEKKQSEASNQAKSRFLANMSHEIRTPLSGVVGMTDLLAGTPMGVEQREIMAGIQASAWTLLNLIEEILDFSKIEAGKVEVCLSDQDISQLVESVILMMKPSADAKSIKLNSWIDLDVSPVIKTDPQLLRQILINLLNNAIKFTAQGSVILKVTPHSFSDTDNSIPRLMFEVIDTGIGIPESQQTRIFERFNQVDDSTTRRYTGSGLGTTITKQLVELLGGTVGVTSRLGEGSRFWFQMPAIPGDNSLDEKRLHEARVMLFTDLMSEHQEILDALQEWQFNINACTSVSDGFLELLNAVKIKRPYDIAIVDETQSEFSSDEVIRTIRAEKSLDYLGLVCVTHFSADREKEEALCNEGCSAVVTLPISADKIRHVLQYALKSSYSSQIRVQPKIFSSVDNNFLPKARILLAEDNLINQKVVKKILELQGHLVDAVGGGKQAIELLQEKAFDLAILDLQMPDVGGIDVIKAYRATNPEKPWVPFLILTANATKEAAQQCDEVGVDAYLTKPVRSAHLLDVVNKLLGRDASKFSTEILIDQPLRAASHEKSGRVLDVGTLEGLKALSKDSGFVGNLAESFLRDTEVLLVDMHCAMENRNISQYRDCAHALADNAAGIGAFSLMSVCSVASNVNQTGFEENGLKLLAKISSTFSVTSQALKYYLTKLEC